MEDSGEIKTDKKGVPATEEFTNETNHPKPSKRKFTLVAVTAIGLIGIAVGIAVASSVLESSLCKAAAISFSSFCSAS